jgi:uncharacterized protein YciI
MAGEPQFVVHLAPGNRASGSPELFIAHVAHLRRLAASGALRLCGPCDDGTALLILQCADADSAARLVDADPLVEVGYYGGRRIVGFREATPDNDYLLRR